MSAARDLTTTALTPTTTGAPPTVPAPATPPPGPRRVADLVPDAPAAVDPNDPDRAFLASAAEELAAWEAGNKGTQPPTAPTPAARAPAARQPTAQPPSPTVPASVVGRLRSELRGRDQEIHELRAELAAARQTAPAAQPQTPAVQEPPPYEAVRDACQAEMVGVRNQMLALGKKYDEGQVDSMEKFVDEFSSLMGQMFVLQGTDIVAFMNTKIPQRPQVALADRMMLDRQLAELSQRHPWVDRLTGEQLDLLQKYAVEEMQAQGLDTTPSALTTYEIRARVAEASEYYGPRWHPNLVQEVEAARTRTTTSPSAAPATTPSAPMPRARAVPQPPVQPPNPSMMGSTALPRGTEPTEADLMNMPFEDLGRLPMRVQA